MKWCYTLRKKLSLNEQKSKEKYAMKHHRFSANPKQIFFTADAHSSMFHNTINFHLIYSNKFLFTLLFAMEIKLNKTCIVVLKKQ